LWRNVPIDTQVNHRAERLVSIARTADVTERLPLKCAAARVLQVFRVAQPKIMRVGSQRQLRVRLQSQLREYVFIIH
jgi:hypothetical protein